MLLYKKQNRITQPKNCFVMRFVYNHYKKDIFAVLASEF